VNVVNLLNFKEEEGKIGELDCEETWEIERNLDESLDS
jgi:hypothetical protein